MTDARSSWWQTLPGILTALAAAVTAVGGLLVTLNKVGLIGAPRDQAPIESSADPVGGAARGGEAPAAVPPADPAPAQAPGTRAAQYTVDFTSGTEAKLRSSRAEGVYQVLSAGIEDRNTGTLTLKLFVRLTSNGPLDLGFWNDTFRLRIDGVRRAPTNFLNDLVPARSSKEGEVIFDLPATAQSLELLLDNNEDSAILPFELRKSG